MAIPATTHAQPDIPEDVLARRWGILALLCTSLIIVIVGNTSLNTALPRLSEDLGASTTDLQWIVDAYSLVFAGLLLPAGALGDRYGRKGALQLGLGIFAVSSLAGAFADQPEQVIAARAVMGLGGALVMPSTLSIIANVFPAEERARAIAIWAGISGAGAAVGPVASGFLLEHYWWGSVLLVNLPIILVALLAGHFVLPKSKDPGEASLDVVGAGLSIVGLSALVYAIIEAPHHGWLSAESAMWFGGAVVVLVVFAAWERRTEEPMLELSLFTDRRFSISTVGITLLFFAMFGMLFLSAQYLQLVLAYTPLEAGLRLLPMSFVMALIAPQTPKLVGRFGANVVAGVGLLLVTIGLLLISLWEAGTSYAQVLASLTVMAAGMAATMAPMTAEMMSSVPPAKAGVGSAMNDTTRELGGALGVAIFGSIVASRYADGIGERLAELPEELRELAASSLGAAIAIAGPGSPVADAATDAFIDGFRIASYAAAAALALAAVVVFRLLPSGRTDPLVSDVAEHHEA